MITSMVALITKATDYNSLLGPVMVAGLTGVIVTLGNIFGNNAVNKANRAKYEVIAKGIVTNMVNKTCVIRSSDITRQLKKVLSNQRVMGKKIDHNTKITGVYDSRIATIDELKSIKKEAMRWAKKKGMLSQLVVIKANSMIEFFDQFLSEDIETITVGDVKDEMQVQIGKVKTSWEKKLEDDKGFVKFFFETSHDKHIDTFFIDLFWITNPQRKINNINVDSEVRSMSRRFFRLSLESLLSTWQAYEIKKQCKSK